MVSKKELRLIIAQCVEAGKGLALAQFMPEGETRTKQTQLMEDVIDNCLKQLEIFCKDAECNKQA